MRQPKVLASSLAAALAITVVAGLHARQSTYDRALEMDRGSVALWQSLKKLHTRASLVLVTAHPDDEDSGMLTYEVRGQGARAATLTLNRGEGGQNVMSDDFYDALGLVRTQELLASDRYFGVQQYFTRVIDFGFSKTQQGTLDKWGHDRVLGDVVRVIRLDRPLVIASVFVGGPSDGHGNHIVAGETAQEAYVAAADPKMFPEQIQAGLRPWRALKVYARAGRGGSGPFHDYVHNTTINGPLGVTVEIPQGDFDPTLGASYTQIARQGLGEQRTQNGGTGVPELGPALSAYHLFDARVKTTDRENGFFDGIDVSLAGIADLAEGADAGFLRDGLSQLNELVSQATREFNAAHPEAIAPRLAQGLAATSALIEKVNASSLTATSKADVNYELQVKKSQFNDAITQALGIYLTANVGGGGGRGGAGGPTFQTAVPGQQFNLAVHVAVGGSDPVTLSSVEVSGPADEHWNVQSSGSSSGEVTAAQPRTLRFDVTVPANAHYTRPYYSRPNTEQPYYNIDDPRYLNLPEAPYPLIARAVVRYRDVSIELAQVVQTTEKINGLGNVMNPLVVAPAISVAIDPHAGIVPLSSKSLDVTVTLHSNVKGAAAGAVQLRLPPGWTSTPASAPFSLGHDGEDQPMVFHVQPGSVTQQAYTITAVATYNGQSFEEGYHTAGYSGLRPYNLYSPATYRTRGVDVKIAPGLTVGYVTGTGDSVTASLENLGIKVHFLTTQDLRTADLSRYDAIVLGIRAYEARADLRTANSRLLEYVNQGGALIVQYNFVAEAFDHDYGPYPFRLSSERVMDENSAVRILAANNPVLSWPNAISDADFRGWFEERGHGFLGSWDPRYTPLLEMHDPNQAPQEGGLLYAEYGKGVYVYEGIALYRQLPEGVPGAYRIFANLLSLAHRPRSGGR